MQFRLRTLMLLLTLVGVLLGVQRYVRLLKAGVPIEIVYRIPLQDSRVGTGPTQILRYRDPWLRKRVKQGHARWVRENRPTDELLSELIVEDKWRMNWESRRCRTVLKQFRNSIIPQAKAKLRAAKNDTDTFHAAGLMGFLDDNSGYDFALRQLLANQDRGETLDRHSLKGFLHAPSEWLKEQAALIAMLEGVISHPTSARKNSQDFYMGQECGGIASEILFKVGRVDAVLAIQRDKLESHNPYEALRAAELILNAGPTESDLNEIIDLMRCSTGKPLNATGPIGPPIADLLLQYDFARTEDPANWRDCVESSIIELARIENAGGFAVSRFDEQRGFNRSIPHGGFVQSICDFGSQNCAEFLRTKIQSKGEIDDRPAALNGLKRLGFEHEWKRKLVAIMESNRPLGKRELDAYCEAKGIGKVPALMHLVGLGNSASPAAAISLAHTVRASSEEIVRLLIAEFERMKELEAEPSQSRSDRYRIRCELCELLSALRKIGGERFESLQFRVEPVDADLQAFVEFLNRNFPGNRLTVAGVQAGTSDVLGYPAYTDTEWHFQFIALASLDCGGHINCDIECDPHYLLSEFAEVAGKEFCVEAVTNDRGNTHFVVGDRTYQLEIHDGWFEYSRLACVLNTVAEDQGLSKRFFVYAGKWNNDDNVVVFATPEQIRELHDEFGITPSNSWKHFMAN